MSHVETLIPMLKDAYGLENGVWTQLDNSDPEWEQPNTKWGWHIGETFTDYLTKMSYEQEPHYHKEALYLSTFDVYKNDLFLLRVAFRDWNIESVLHPYKGCVMVLFREHPDAGAIYNFKNVHELVKTLNEVYGTLNLELRHDHSYSPK